MDQQLHSAISHRFPGLTRDGAGGSQKCRMRRQLPGDICPISRIGPITPELLPQRLETGSRLGCFGAVGKSDLRSPPPSSPWWGSKKRSNARNIAFEWRANQILKKGIGAIVTVRTSQIGRWNAKSSTR